MLTPKLLAAVGLAGALLLGASTEASANPWRGPHFSPAPIYRAPVYRAPVVYSTPVVYRAPAYSAPVYSAPVYSAPVYSAPVYSAPVYVPAPRVVFSTPAYGPVYRPIGWRHPHWVRYGHRW